MKASNENDKNDESTYDQTLKIIKAWKGITSSSDIGNDRRSLMEISISDEELISLESDDDNHLLVQSWETQEEDGHPYLQLEYSISNNTDQILIHWKGYGSQPFMREAKSFAKIFIFNIHFDNWEERSHIQWNVGDDNHSLKEIRIEMKSLSDYLIDNSSIYFLILGPYGGGDSTATLETEYMNIRGSK